MRLKIASARARLMGVTKPTLVVIALLILATTIRLFDLGNVPIGLYYDEITSVYHPYLYSQGEMSLPHVSVLTQHIAGKLFLYELAGPSAFWIRFPSVVYGVLFVAVCWILAKRLYGTEVGLIACLLAVVVPWALHFSRYGVTTVIDYVFYITLAVYLLVVYFQRGQEKFKYAAFLAIAISFYSHSMALIFNFLFFPIILAVGGAFNRTRPSRILIDVFLFCATLLIVASPFLTSYLSSAERFPYAAYTTFEHSHNSYELIGKIIYRASLHLSPDFLVLSGGKSFASSSGSFSETIPSDGLYYYSSAGKVGMLNVYGILVFVGLLWLVYRMVKSKRIDFKFCILSWWIVSYAVASGFAYYDNPNPARNIVGLPVFILVISVVIEKIWSELFKPQEGYVFKLKIGRQLAIKALKTMFLVALLVPSILYLYTYFETYGSSYNYFDYDYKLLSDYLTENRLWSSVIVINETRTDKWYGKEVLSFYNHSARENVIMGDLPTAVSLLGFEEGTVIYVTRDMSSQHVLSSLAYYKLRCTIDYPNENPAFFVWELTGLKEKLVIDDSLASRWAPLHGTLFGEKGMTITFDEDSVVRSGSRSLKIIIASGSWDWTGIQYSFEPEMNWSDARMLCFQWYGSRSEIIVQLIVTCAEGEYYYSFTDNFREWRNFAVSFIDMQKRSSPLLSSVKAITFAFWGAGQTTMYLDKISIV